MPLVVERAEVLGIFAEARRRGWVIPAFGTENLTTTEAVLAGALARSEALGCPDLPVMLAVTNRYPGRTQTAYYTHTRRWEVGLRLFLADLDVLAESGSPFGGLRILIHLDHIQHDLDAELWSADLSRFSSIMFDASTLPFPENIAATAAFVGERGSEIVVEGACDEVGGKENRLTTAAEAERFATGTGVDWIVANLGTEHRAGASTLAYARDVAREISAIIGPRLVLHGASSVAADQLPRLFGDGIAKVNLWTALERDSSARLLREMTACAAQVGGPALAREMCAEGLLGARADLTSDAALSHFTTAWRQQVVFEEMKRQVASYFEVWYPESPSV